MTPRTRRAIDDAGKRALSWLTALETSFERPASFRDACRRRLLLLVAYWLCEAGLRASPDARRTRRVARRLRQQLDLEDAASVTRELAACDSALVLVAALILLEVRVESTRFRSFLESVANLLRTENGHGAGQALMARFLLSQMGLLDAPGPVRVGSSSGWPANLLEVSRAEVGALSEEVAIATQFGARPLDDSDRLADLVAVTPVWTLFYLRLYDLDMGTRVLRTMTYLGNRENQAFDQSVDLLLAQQRTAGCFGFVAADSSSTSAENTEEREVAATIACLWALAEAANRQFRLFAPRRVREVRR